MKTVCLIVYDMSVWGGVEQVSASLSAALTRHFHVHLLSICAGSALAYDLHPDVKYSVVLEKEERLRVMQKKLRPRLKAYFAEHHVDVALIQGTYPGFLVSPLRFGTKTKLVFCDHGALMNQWNEKDMVVIRLLAARLCHKVVTLTEQNLLDYRKKFWTSRKKLRCIYNWMDETKIHSPAYDPDARRLLSAGRFSEEKGFDQLVKAYGPVAEKHPDWTLDIYGDGPLLPAVTDLVAQLGLEGKVRLMGMQKDLPRRYGQYAFYVLPSYREGMPLVLLEAKANRLPIVSFDIQTGPREIVRDGVDGILVPPRDLEKLGQAMCRLMDDGELRSRMAASTQEDLDRFSQKTVLAQWVDLIENL